MESVAEQREMCFAIENDIRRVALTGTRLHNVSVRLHYRVSPLLIKGHNKFNALRHSVLSFCTMHIYVMLRCVFVIWKIYSNR